MKKKIAFLLSVLVVLVSFSTSFAANKMWWANALTGGGEALDGILANLLTAGDGAFALIDSGSTIPKFYTYRLYESGSDEVSPNIIKPDNDNLGPYAGNKRWHLVDGVSQSWGGGVPITWTYDASAGTDCTSTWGNNVAGMTCGLYTLTGGQLISDTSSSASRISIRSQAVNTSTSGDGTVIAAQGDLTSTAVTTAGNKAFYGVLGAVTKSGLDTNADTINSYGVFGSASNTGSDNFGARISYGGYFTATGDAAGASTAYGVYGYATGADTNYAGYFSGNVAVTGSLTTGASQTIAMSAAAGVLTIAGAGGTYNENLTFNFESVENVVGVGTGTSVGAIRYASTLKQEFGDSGTYINQSADGTLAVVSDTNVKIVANDEDLNISKTGTNGITVGTNTGVTKITVTPTITVAAPVEAPEVLIDCNGSADPYAWCTSANASTLTVANVSRTIINSYGRAEAQTVTLPTAAAGMTFIAVVGTQHDSLWKIQRAGSDTIHWNGTAGKTYFSETNEVVGSRVSCFTFKTGAAAWTWMCGSSLGTWDTD